MVAKQCSFTTTDMASAVRVNDATSLTSTRRRPGPRRSTDTVESHSITTRILRAASDDVEPSLEKWLHNNVLCTASKEPARRTQIDRLLGRTRHFFLLQPAYVRVYCRDVSDTIYVWYELLHRAHMADRHDRARFVTLGELRCMSNKQVRFSAATSIGRLSTWMQAIEEHA